MKRSVRRLDRRRVLATALAALALGLPTAAYPISLSQLLQLPLEQLLHLKFTASASTRGGPHGR